METEQKHSKLCYLVFQWADFNVSRSQNSLQCKKLRVCNRVWITLSHSFLQETSNLHRKLHFYQMMRNKNDPYWYKKLCFSFELLSHITPSPWKLTLGIFYSLLKQLRRVSSFTSASPFTGILYWSAGTTHKVSTPRLAPKVIGFIGEWVNSGGWLRGASCRVWPLLG